MDKALNVVTEDDASGFLGHCGYQTITDALGKAPRVGGVYYPRITRSYHRNCGLAALATRLGSREAVPGGVTVVTVVGVFKRLFNGRGRNEDEAHNQESGY